jgi:hypothetical protein
VQEFLTKRPTDTMSDGRIAYPKGPPQPHDYGTLPFTFIPYKRPVRDFWTSSIGDLLHQAEIRIDDRLSLIDEAIAKHLNPLPVAEGMPAEWKLIVEPQRFVRVPSGTPRISPSGGFEPGDAAKLYYLQVKIESEAAWADLTNYINQILEAARVPATAVRMEQSGVASGIALIVEQAPLLTRARKRRGQYSVYEEDLGKRSLICAGNHYGGTTGAGLVSAAAKGKLTTGWPQPAIPVPTPDRLQLLQDEVKTGFTSYIQAVAQWYGVPRAEALEMIKQIETDNAELLTLAPSLAVTAADEPVFPGQEVAPKEEPGDKAA